MAWNEPGDKRRDPWQNNGNGKDDLSNMLRRIKAFFGWNNGGPGGSVFFVVVGILIAWLAFDSWRTIDESQRGVVLRFGKFDRIMGAGLNFKWPSPIERVFVVNSTGVRSTSDDKVRMLTKDENLVILDFNVQYQINDPYQYQFAVRDQDDTLRQAAESAVRQVIGGSEMDVILSGERTALAINAKEILQKTLDRYKAGIIVTGFNFQNVRPPPEVKQTFDDAIAARENKQQIENEAKAYASKVVPEARGEAARIRAEADGAKQASIAIAEGEAERFGLIARQYQRAPAVTKKRLLLETMQEVLEGSSKVLAEGSGNKILYLPVPKSGGQTVTLPPYDATFETAAPETMMAPSAEGDTPALEDRPNRRGRE